ncbi:MFS transporter, partial [Jeotgalibaca porci]|uniref:MFS transporter n=1 Tax=Jeotgalibaca porci TaxID=1868793 RepID=UPI0035A1A65D
MAKEIAKASQNELTWKHKIGYAAGDAGGVMTLVLVSSYMTRYITNVLTIPYATLSVLLLIWNIWDMVNDPLMGTLMDKTFAKAKSDRDKFRPWILYSIAPIVLGIIAFFSVPSLLNGFAAVAALFIFKIIYELGYTMMNIGMGSLLGTMATNDPERATLSSARGMGSTVGSLVAMVTVPQILSRLGENPQGYFWAAVVCGILGGFSVLVHYLWTEERNIAEKNSDPNDEKNNVKFTDIINVFKENRAFLALSLHSIIIVFGTTIYNQ